MRVAGRFDTPAMGNRQMPYPVTGEGAVELTDELLRIEARVLPLQWLTSALGIVGFFGGLALLFAVSFSGADLPKLAYAAIWFGPMIVGLVAGSLIARAVARRRGVVVQEIPRKRVRTAEMQGDLCLILVGIGWGRHRLVYFVPANRLEGAALAAELGRRG